MEVSIVRKRVREVIEQAQKAAAARRTANQQATSAWEQLLEQVVTPVMQQVSQVLKSEGYGFGIITPAVRFGSRPNVLPTITSRSRWIRRGRRRSRSPG